MANVLRKYFPMLRTREEIRSEINSNDILRQIFSGWNYDAQETFLNFCTGVRGAKLLYDSFFKEIMNPDVVPERLEELLSLILDNEVKIVKVLPNEAVNITDNRSLLVMDIVVELDDGSIANVEVQKVGYAFPGQRCACYSSDLLLRQYKRIKGEKADSSEKFSYRDMKRVYTIVFFEKSTKIFHQYPNEYIHRAKQKTDTGLEIELLQEFVFIPLDIFREIQHNRGITDKLEAWLTLLSMDEPDSIIQLIQLYPEFRGIYEDVYRLCRDIEKVMGMFSEELLELDRNTVEYMIDEMQNAIDALRRQMGEKDAMLQDKDIEIQNLKSQIEELKKSVMK